VVGEGAVEVKDGEYFGINGTGFEHVWVHGLASVLFSIFKRASGVTAGVYSRANLPTLV
jgi:hypothetical protein